MLNLAEKSLRIVFAFGLSFGIVGRGRGDFIDIQPEVKSTAPVPAPTVTPGPRHTPARSPQKSVDKNKNSGEKIDSNPVPADSHDSDGLFGKDVTQHNSNAPIRTKGDTLEGSLAKGKMTLTGNVEIQQADTIMHSESAELFSKPGTRTPEKAVAKGKVTIKKSPSPTVPEISAVAEELEYFVSTRKIILRGKPKIWRGQELLQGDVIEAALDTGEIKVIGARGVVDPKSQKGSGSAGKTSLKQKSDTKH